MKYYKDSQGIVYFYESDGSQDRYIKSNLIKITKEEADILLSKLNDKRKEENFANLDYSAKRQMEYPSIGDQLDALYKAGVFPADLSAKIKAVKDKYPKQ